METHFNERMKNENVPLLNDFASYSKSLPVRIYDSEYFQLFKLKYFSRSKDLIDMSDTITKITMGRPEVRYISAPSTSGKTSSVLPAILASQHRYNNETHYFYLAFQNNNMRTFSCMPSTPNYDRGFAEDQGAAFIFECVKTLLERPDNLDDYRIQIEESPILDIDDVVREMNEYLADKLGEDCRIWFHVDEHAKMCGRSPDDSKGNVAGFSYGAMTTLAQVKRARVIATYTDRPSSIPGIGSSGIGRYPVALAPIDINQVMSTISELYINPSDVIGEDEQRLMSSLKVRLAFKLEEFLYIPVLHQRGVSSEVEKFLNDFVNAKNGPNPLVDCNELFRLNISLPNVIEDAAIGLLLGYEDREEWTRQFFDVVSLPRGMFSVSIKRLLQTGTVDWNYEIYNTGRELFKSTLVMTHLLSSTPLEAAYYWTLSCMSTLFGTIQFGRNPPFRIPCKSLEPGRLFPGTDSSVYNLEFLKLDTMYYCYEGDGDCKHTHPLASLFFITKADQLVLVDITGGNERRVNGIVLAPNLQMEIDTAGEPVSVVSGKFAMQLLGGLRQIAIWSEEA